MPRLTTGNEHIGTIEWTVEFTWQQRKDIFDRKLIADGGPLGLNVETVDMLKALWPACIKGWSRAEALDDEQFWSVPDAHRHELALDAATWLHTGMTLAEWQAALAEEEEADPFVSDGPDAVTE